MNSNKIIENSILEIIKQKAKYPKTIEQLIKRFDDKLSEFNPVKNCFDIESYFGKGIGQSGAKKKLLLDGKVKSEWCRDYLTKNGNTKNDFKGLYVFVHEDSAIYAGISKGVIGRIFQHTKGRSHNTSTLAFNIGLIRHEIITGKKYTGGRKDFNFVADVEPAKEFLMKQKIAFLNIDDTQELYLFEVYVAMKLQIWLNKFDTH